MVGEEVSPPNYLWDYGQASSQYWPCTGLWEPWQTLPAAGVLAWPRVHALGSPLLWLSCIALCDALEGGRDGAMPSSA